MIPARQVVWAALLLWLAAVGQGLIPHAVRVGFARPDLILLTLACSAPLVGGERGTILGLWAGLLTAAETPESFGSVLVSRVLAGAFAGGLGRSVARDSPVVPPLVVLAATLVSEVAYAALAPAYAVHHPRPWLRALGGEMLYNAALALPVTWLLRRLHVGRPTGDPFA